VHGARRPGHWDGAGAGPVHEGEPPHEDRTTARGSAPLHLRRKRRPSLWHRGPGPTGHPPWVSVSECRESEPPRAVARLFISTENNDPVYDMGAQAHKSYPLGVGS
jgi:hypothetical protein